MLIIISCTVITVFVFILLSRGSDKGALKWVLSEGMDVFGVLTYFLKITPENNAQYENQYIKCSTLCQRSGTSYSRFNQRNICFPNYPCHRSLLWHLNHVLLSGVRTKSSNVIASLSLHADCLMAEHAPYWVSHTHPFGARIWLVVKMLMSHFRVPGFEF